MKTNIPATKTNLIKTKKDLAMTKEGYQLLDEKRKILLNELTAIIHIVDRLQKDTDKLLKEAYQISDLTYLTVGEKKLDKLQFSFNIVNTLSISHRRVMGVSIPKIMLEQKEKPPYYSSLETTIHADMLITKFKKVIAVITQLAEKKIALLRIAKETQKTIRKVNALEKIYIPYYQDTAKEITEKLEEETCESFTLLKTLKAQLQKSSMH